VLGATGLAGGALVAAWLLSAAYHVAVFALMYVLPWLSGIVGDRIDAPPPFTDIVGEVDQPKVSLTPEKAIKSPAQPMELGPLEFEPEEFQSVSDLAPKQKETMTILGIGTGGGEFDKYGFELTPGNRGPDFFGLGGQARGARVVVYVVDRSGSMLTTMDGVKKELRKSIGQLRRSQKFHLIFFNSGTPLENPPRRPVSSIKAHKREAFEFIERVNPVGGTDPRPAMRRAFALQPDVIYFLTDGEFNAVLSDLMEMLDRLNHKRKVRIFTIAYVSQEGAPALQRIAREHNGEYRFVSEDEIF
jgi:hypothetical protein